MRPRALRYSFVLLLSVIFTVLKADAQAPNTISTLAGGGANSTSATTAYLPGPTDAVRDGFGNTYVVSPSLNTVYKITPLGQLSIYAGTGVAGFSGDGGLASSAELNSPVGLALDPQGNLFIADSANNRIRRVDVTTGQITTYAGSGNQYNGTGFFGGYSGDGGPAASALLDTPESVALDGNGNLFIADVANDVVRVVDNSPQHIIATYAGSGLQGTTGTANGDGGPARSAQLALAFFGNTLATDANGNLYIADTNHSVVRIVDTSSSHIISTFAGSPSRAGTFFGDGGPANAAGLNLPTGVFMDGPGNLYIADRSNLRIRKADTTAQHTISTVAGNGSPCISYASACGDSGAATSASLDGPSSVFADASENLLIADFGTDRIRLVTPGTTPSISTFAGGGTGGLGGPAASAILAVPFSVLADSAGDLFLKNNFQVNRVDGTTRTITAYAGNNFAGPVHGAGDNGPATQANINPFALARDNAGNLFVSDTRLLVRRVDALTQTITTYAGTGARCNPSTNPSCGDGALATGAVFFVISGMATDSQGNLYISDSSLNRIRRVDALTGIITNYAGTGARGYTGDNGPATSATFSTPFGVAFDSQDNLYVADGANNVIRKIDNTSQHTVTTYAFNGLASFGGDGGAALSASMSFPQEIAVDSNGNVFVGGGMNNVVRRIDAGDQTVTTVAGDIHNLDGGFSGDGGPSTQALLSNFGVAIDGNKNLYIADPGNNRIRTVHLAPVAAVDSSLLVPFGTFLPGQTSAQVEVTIGNTGLDDLTITNVSTPTNFFVTNECVNPVTNISSVSPGAGSCFLFVAFAAPAGAASGTVFSGNLTFSTNDPANPTISLPVTATVGALPGFTLSVTEAGVGTGTIISSPSGIACSSGTCAANFALNQQVTLTATGRIGFVLTGWTVNGLTTTCPGIGPCTLTMNQAQNVTATFGSASMSVAALGNGSGTVTSSPAGINCTVTSGVTSGTCIFSGFPPGTQTVTLTATPTGNSTFSGWLGFCDTGGIIGAGTGPCQFPLIVASVITLSGAQATAVFSGPAQSFTQGQIFVGSVDGMIFVYNPNGTLAQVLNSGNLGGTIAGMNFDRTGNLYAANPTTTAVTGGTVEFFGNNGSGPTTFGTGYNSEPIGVLLDPSGNVFVGQGSGQNSLLEFAGAQNTAPSNTFFPAFESAGVAYLELLHDNASVLYTSASPSVKNFDILNEHQNPDLATNLPGGAAYAIRELGDKSVLVANTTEIVRLSPAGAVIQTYTPAEGALFYALNLDPDGTSFWTGDASGGKVFHIRISDGAILQTINTGLGFASSSLAFSTIFGVAVFGQPQAGGADVSVAMTSSPASVPPGSQVTYTISVTNHGPVSAANVAMTDAFPAGMTFVSAATSLGTCSGTTTVTCTLGTMTSGQSATMTVVANLTQAGTVLNTVNVTSTTPDPNTANNSGASSTQVTSSGNLLAVAETGSGLGSVSSNPAGINCQPTCSARFSGGTVVTLTATPNAGSTFVGWSGACSGTGACVVTMNSAQNVTANFSLSGSTACNAAGATIWTGGASGNWSAASNWSTDQVPNGPGVTVCISDGHGAAAVNLDISAEVGTLIIDAGSSVTIENNLDLEIAGSIYNAGQIIVAANGNQTNLSMTGAITLNGGGSISMTIGPNGGTPVIRQDSASSSLTNVNNTISGRGQIGNNNVSFVNQAGGIVNANSSGNGLLVNAPSAVNQGLFESTNGGILQVAVTLNNSGGTISGTSGSQVQFSNGANIQGGLLTTATGAGFFGVVASNGIILDGNSQGPLTNAAVYTISNNADTQLIGTIKNSGSFQVAANGNQTNLSMSGTVTLTGGGSVVMSVGTNGGTPVIRQDTAGSSLINVDNTISGIGQVGNGSLAITNQAGGTVNAVGNNLLINATQFVNQGLLGATANSTLQINTLIVNAGGNITANGGGSSVQLFNGTRIEGGQLNTINGAAFFGTAASNTAVLDGSTQGQLVNAAAYTILNNGNTELTGTINNTGSFHVAADGNQTNLSASGAVTLTGGGLVSMTVTTNGGTPVIRQDTGGSTLTNVNNTFAGTGQIGNGSLTFINQPGGVVNANASGKALLVNSVGTVNQGLFESAGGGILQVNVLVNNLGGLITAGSSSQVQFSNGSNIQGGTFTSAGGATFFGVVSSNTVVLDGTTHGQLNNAAAFTIANNGDAELIGTINNTGSLQIAANANQTNLSMSGPVILTGGGLVSMTIGTLGGTPVIRQDTASSSLTNVNNTIAGAGQVGNGNVIVVNQAGGIVDANNPNAALLVNALGAVNQGQFESSNGGILQINVALNNAGGSIAAGGSSQVQFFNGANIQGGLLSTAAGASFFGVVGSNGVMLDGTTHGQLNNAAIFTVSNNANTELTGTINNTGSIQVAANGNQTNLSAIGAVTLTGSGSVVMTVGSNGGTPVIRQDTAGSSLTNVNNTFTGTGQIGNGNLNFINQANGKVNANISGAALLFNAVGGANQGLLESTGGGILQFNVTLNNSSGTIAAGAGSQVQFFNSSNIQGGLLTSDPAASFFGVVASNNVVLDGTTHGPLANAAAFTVSNNGDTQLVGTINNSGAFLVAANGNQTNLSISGAVTLGGAGSVVMSVGSNGGTPVFRQVTASSSLTNSGNSITGPGQLQIPTYSQTAGLIRVPAGISDAISTISIVSGNAQVDGSLGASGGVSTSGTGFISGTGTIPSNVSNAGITEAGDIPAAGTLAIGGTFNQASAGSYEVAIGGLTAGSQYSRLNITGAAALAGALNIRFINGFTPASGNQFTILTASSVSGTFATINSPALPAGLAWTVNYTATSVILSVGTGSPTSFTLTVTEPGNGSGTVTDNLGGINCVDTAGVVTGSCSASYQSGTVVTLTATPAAGDTFNGWSTCAGTAPCSVTMNGNQTEQATFGALVSSFSVSVAELGTGTGSVTDNLGAINCTEANGIASGTCSASYPSGTPVTLTESATSPSTFGGWGGACSTSGTATTCPLSVTSALNVTANFLPPPVSMPLTFNPGTNVVQQAPFDCPSNPNPTPGNPCTDRNAHAFQLQIAQVNSTVNLTVTATEVRPSLGDGLCEVGNTVLNDFDCRFATFFNFGTSTNGGTIVPLCYPYANGNCVHYQVYSGTPGTEPDPSTYVGPIDWKITWNNDSFVPPAPYTGSTPHLYDDPGEPVAPGTASGDVCGQPMTIDGVAQSFSCQFEFDITTFFDPSEPVDAGIGGHTKQLTDVVVAFPPANSGQLNATSTPDAASVAAGTPIGFTIAVSNPGPGLLSSVSLNDPLPGGAEINWSVSPAFSGPGTCSIGGAVGSQVLTCAFGDLEVGGNASVHVASASASPGSYVNSAAVAASNQRTLTVAAVAVHSSAPSFSGLTGSQTILAGTPSINLSGTISAGGTPTVFPQSGETISITINGTAFPATITSNGAFAATFPTSGIPASGTPYTIAYSYGGDANLTAAADASTTLTVNAVVSNATLTITELGSGTGAITDNTGQINCAESNGIVTGNCSATYPSGTQVLLAEAPTSPSTFGGWSNACASSGTGTSCGLTVSSNLTATANFLPPPAVVNFTFTPGTNVAQQGVFNCPSNPNPSPGNPCTDANAHTLQLQIPQVNTPFTVTLTATEVPPNTADGLCKVGNNVLNDFDCRFATFFNYGTDNNGNTIVPLCYPFANGNCVHYAVFSGTPGTEPDPSFYTGPVNWNITWNNDTFVPPAPYTGSTPRLYDDPDYAPTPTSAVGSVCSQPMTINGAPQAYSCQFEFDITTFFNPTAPVDAGIGGHTKQLNDVVVAFPPTTTGSGQITSTSSSAATIPGSPISFTITVSNIGPGTENSVTLNDPLPNVSSASWTFSPAFSGPGTCLISGDAGAQLLSCKFGNLPAGTNFTIGVTNPTAAAGTYTNTATISATNQQVLSISSVTVQSHLTSFTSVTKLQSIVYGTASISLSGVIAAPGPLYPPAGETISVTIDGIVQSAPIGNNGSFSLKFPTATIPVSNPPGFTITYSYAGDGQFTAATNTATTLTVTKSKQAITLTGVPATATYDSTFTVSATASSGLTVTVTASGACTISSSTVTMTSGTGTCSLAANQPGNSNYLAAPQVTASTTAQKAASTTLISSNAPNPSNAGQAVAIGVKVTGSGTPSGSVQVSANTGENCTATLASGAGTCSITFTAAGARTLTATYSGDNNFVGGTSAGVSQTVNATGAATLKIAPSSVSFGKVYVGLASIQSVTLTNTGTLPVSISNASVITTNSGASKEFAVSSFACPPALAVNKSCVIQVSFSPAGSQTGVQSASLVITDAAVGSPQSVPMTGVPFNPRVSLSTSSLSFGSQKVGTTSSSMKITLKSTGTTPLNLRSVSIKGNFAIATGTTCVNGDTLSPSDTCIINVTFTPKSRREAHGAVIIIDNALVGEQIVSLSGTGN